jgi:uncharacterized protein YceK
LTAHEGPVVNLAVSAVEELSRFPDLADHLFALTKGLDYVRCPAWRGHNMGKAAAWALLTASLVGGCGTMGNLWSCCSGSGGERIYGGVCKDVQLVAEGVAQGFHPDEDGPWFPLAAACLMTLDLPLSAIGDTLTLPLTIPATLDKIISPDPVAPRPESNNPAPAHQS